MDQELAVTVDPARVQRALLIQRGVVLDAWRRELARGTPDLTGRLADRSRAISASLSGVANGAAAATWSSVNTPVASASSSAGKLRSASLVTVTRLALAKSVLVIRASHCASDEHPSSFQYSRSPAARTSSVLRRSRRAPSTVIARNSPTNSSYSRSSASARVSRARRYASRAACNGLGEVLFTGNAGRSEHVFVYYQPWGFSET